MSTHEHHARERFFILVRKNDLVLGYIAVVVTVILVLQLAGVKL